jgi:hypothetical protein
MTPQEIAARLPELTGGPHDDDTITALAQITAEAIRALNHATIPHALTEPATVYRVLGELATAAHRLPQLCSQLARWLDAENTAGRLAHDSGALPRALHEATASLGVLAASDAAQLAGALDRAQQATAGLYRPSGGGEDQ